MVYEGYVLKIPVFVCNERENKYGMALNLGCVTLANFAAYQAMKRYKLRRPVYMKSENKIAFGYYTDSWDKLNKFAHQM